MTHAAMTGMAFLGAVASVAFAAGGEVVITFDKAETGKPTASYTDKDRDVVFALAHKPARSKAAGRVPGVRRGAVSPHGPTLRSEAARGCSATGGWRLLPVRGTLPNYLSPRNRSGANTNRWFFQLSQVWPPLPSL